MYIKKTIVTTKIPKKAKKIEYLKETMQLHRAQKALDENTIVFKCNKDMQKPEIKQYLEKLYGLDILKVNTQYRVGKTRVNVDTFSLLIRKI